MLLELGYEKFLAEDLSALNKNQAIHGHLHIFSVFTGRTFLTLNCGITNNLPPTRERQKQLFNGMCSCFLSYPFSFIELNTKYSQCFLDEISVP